MQKICLLIFLFYAFGLPVSGQNLVLNPSFEDYTACPITIYIISWNGNYSFASIPPDHWINPTEATPDYYNSCAIGDAGVPLNYSGYQFAHTGSAYAGIITWSPMNNYYEYITGTLSEPTIPGQTYELSFWASCSGIGAYNANHLSLSLTPDLKKENGTLGLFFSPQLVSQDVLTDTINWVRYTTTWIATDSMKFVTIGHFPPVGLPDITVHTSNNGLGGHTYYYIDDISVVKIAPLLVSPNIQKCASDSVHLTASGDGIEYKWEPGGFTGKSIVVFPIKTTTYTVTMTRESGATQTNTVTVIIGSNAIMTDLPECVENDSEPYQLVGFPEGGTFSGNGVWGNYWFPSELPIGVQANISYSGQNSCGSFSITQQVNRPLAYVHI